MNPNAAQVIHNCFHRPALSLSNKGVGVGEHCQRNAKRMRWHSHRIPTASRESGSKNISNKRRTLAKTSVFVGESDFQLLKIDAGYFLPLGKTFPSIIMVAGVSHKSGNATAMPPHRFGIPTASATIKNR